MDETSPKASKKSKSSFQFPHVFALLFALIVVVSLFTYIIPAGEYDEETTEEGRTVVIEGTYHEVNANPIGFFDIFNAVHKGMVKGADIIFFIFIVGGVFGILNATKAIESGMNMISEKMKGKELFIIPVTMILFAIGGATFGMAEETIPMILIFVPLALRLGFDSVVGTAMVIVGSYAGFTAAFMNPFTVGVAQDIAELPLFSGMGFRFIIFIVFVTVTIIYVMWYASKVKRKPEVSVMYEIDQQWEAEALQTEDSHIFQGKQKVIIALLGLTIVGIAIGATVFEWYIMEISSLFLLMGIIVGFVGRLRVNEIASAFTKGCSDLVVGALVVGFAHGILVVLEDSNTIDTILYAVSNIVGQLPTSLSAISMYVTQNFMNFIVQSGSGQAALTMPVMTPLADLVGVSRQTAVLAFQLGDGITNTFVPTSSVLMASIVLAKIPWGKWVKWVIPLLLIQFILGLIFVTIAHEFVWPA